MLVDHVAFVVDEIALGVDSSALSINEIAFSVFVQDGCAERVHLEVSENILNVELGEWEYLRYLVLTEVLCLEDLPAILVDDVAKFVDEVPFGVDSPALVVDQVALLIRQWLDVAIGILVELAYDVADIKAAAVVVEELGKIAVRGRVRLV